MTKRKGTFLVGFDPRRHELTLEEKRRGGINSWFRTMADVRLSLGLAMPHEKIREYARRIHRQQQRTRHRPR